MRARIYKPARNAMQSGQAKSRDWVLEIAPDIVREIDPLMGWTGSGDTSSQVRLQFDSQQAAEKYAREHGLDYVVSKPQQRKPVIRPGGYGENFATSRRATWTH